MIRVAVYRSGAPDRYVDIPQTGARIGRASENDIVLEDPDKGVSRIHAELRNDQGRWTIIDLNSQNGVHVRGRRVTREAVEPGTAITVGPYQLVLEDTAVDAGPVDDDGNQVTRGPDHVEDHSAADVRSAAAAPAARPAVPPRRGGGIPHLVPIAAAVVLVLLVVGAFAWLKAGAKQEPAPAPPPVVQDAKPETPPPPTETPLQQQVRTATERLDANDLEGAAAAIDEALKLGPDSAEAQALRTRLDAARAALVTAPVAGPVATSGPTPIPDWPSDWPKPARRDREPASVYIKRGQEIQRTYNTGSSSLDRGDVALAISSFEAVLGLEPGFHDAPQKLQRARQLQQAAQARDDAGRAFEAGRRAEDKREIGAAITQYQRAVAADANRKDAAESVERLRTYVNQMVPTLLRDARIAEAYRDSKKAEALYEQAQRLLPDGDPRRREVEQELKRIRGGSL